MEIRKANISDYVCVDNDNISMQKLLEKNKFVKCGTIYVGVDKSPRIAFEKHCRNLFKVN